MSKRSEFDRPPRDFHLTPQEAAILALLDHVQRLERRFAKLESDFAKFSNSQAQAKMKRDFTGLKVVNGRRGTQG